MAFQAENQGRPVQILTKWRTIMIRPSVPEETPILVRIAHETNVFKPHEIIALQEVLDDYYAANIKFNHRAVTFVQDGQVAGFAYYAPAAMTDRTWYLYWIAVSKQIQARGVGGKLLRHAEEEIKKENGRLFLIETSSLPQYDLTRKFYVKHGYETHAVLRDYYADGDDMVIFRKHFGDTTKV
jgi:ribosomal protein S18 acetylase RimI-like enzyme